MPDPVKLLKTIHHAIGACQRTPGRQGGVVHLQEAFEVLIAGDLHGNVENFRRLLQRAALAQHPRRHLVLQELIHGPYRYPAGGDKSHQLVDLAAALKCQYPTQVHLLQGNHELAERTGQLIGKADDLLNELFREGIDCAYGSRSEEIYQAYLQLFAALPLVLRTANRGYLSHSLPSVRNLARFDPTVLEQNVPDERELRGGGSVHALVWGRDTEASHVAAFLRKVDADWLITGHIPTERGYETPNDRQIILDCIGSPACFCLFPADRPLTHQELVGYVGTL